MYAYIISSVPDAAAPACRFLPADPGKQENESIYGRRGSAVCSGETVSKERLSAAEEPRPLLQNGDATRACQEECVSGKDEAGAAFYLC